MKRDELPKHILEMVDTLPTFYVKDLQEKVGIEYDKHVKSLEFGEILNASTFYESVYIYKKLNNSILLSRRLNIYDLENEYKSWRLKNTEIYQDLLECNLEE